MDLLCLLQLWTPIYKSQSMQDRELMIDCGAAWSLSTEQIKDCLETGNCIAKVTSEGIVIPPPN